MASTSRLRLEQLRKLVQANIDALPDRPVSPEPAAVLDDDASGGVSLEGLSLENEPPQATASSKQLPVDPPIKTAPVPTDSAASIIPTQAPPNPDRRFVWVEGAVSSWNLGNMEKSTSTLPASGLHRGDLAPAHYPFTPILPLSKYPYKFCNPAQSQDITEAAFDKGQFWRREWDLYYTYDIDSNNPVILVRETQVQDLLDEINKKLNLVLRITDAQREDALVIRFPNHPACLPRYLGRSDSRDAYDSMVNNAPDSQFIALGERRFGPPDSVTLEDFRQIMADISELQKNKNKAKRETKHVDRMGRQLSMINQFKRAERCLGFHPGEGTASSVNPKAIDPSCPAPFAFDQDVVFVAVDLEAYERDHNRITEVGIATLDTRDLIGVAPGPDGECWRGKIKARHFRINENKHLVNRDFCAGHPDGFEFGESTFVGLKEAPQHVAAVFNPPFGVHATNTPVELIHDMLNRIDLTEKRNIIFLGHDTLTDVKYLQQLGYDPLKNNNIIEAMDTAKIYQAWRRELQPTSLGRILLYFDIIGWKLHNAGNDAVYTVQVMLATCVREATIRGSPELNDMRAKDKATREAAARENAVQRAKEDADGWSDNEAAGDGGPPVPLTL
ncbi:hypothetical protein CC86DRAFT_27947 [Ophiobolus disseminans]|uniref:Gfd2/YDR514C-like C-terminal domain-containing protein n=1 Tax=Ophiobolus disseminans TaxID=1469910 RepID=A0A6A6ZZM1_9PLEO|nr:hypothetical protein CC86DRAFT_27947 [Ophiobolus disseminans]